MKNLIKASIVAVALSGCSFVDQVHVNLGDGVRLISINDRDLVIERNDATGDGMLFDGAFTETNFGASPVPGPQATGFECSLEQSGTRSSLLSSLFSPPEKTSIARLTCRRLFDPPNE